jgi:adenosylhomocysteine nucleosidase
MSGADVTELIEQAFEYRGYVTVSRRDGSQLVGFIYDRGPTHVDLFDERAVKRIRLPIDDIADIAFTGEDSTAKAQRIWERRRGGLEPRETSAWGDWEERPTLILVALPLELRCVARALDTEIRDAAARGRLGGGRAIGLSVGMGGGAAHAVAAERPGLVISCGFSGALEASLGSGDLVLASSVRDEGGDRVEVAESVLRVTRAALDHRARVAEGEILCATHVAATREEKRGLARPGRLAVDLESWAAARAAQRAGIPWLAIRVVLDPLDVDLPAFTRERHAGYVGPALRHVLGGPRAAVELARLGLRAGIASRSLERALRALAPSLGNLAHPPGSP